jgi:hypothetical protein
MEQAMATVQVNGSAVTATSTSNNGGVMKANGGDVEGATLSTTATVSPFVGVFASTVVSGVNAVPSIAGGEFPHNHTFPISFLMTEELAGQSNTSLQNPDDRNDLVRNPAPLEVLRTRRFTTAVRENKWNQYTGEFASGYPVTEVDLWWDISAATGVSGVPDTAATPSSIVPGYLTYQYGGVQPSGDTYEARTA